MPAFGGVTFRERWEDGFAPLPEEELQISVEPYPDTDEAEIQLGGLSPVPLTLPVIIASLADLTALRAVLRARTAGTLTGCWDGSHTNMLLVGIRSPRGAPDGTQVWAELEFLQAS